VKSPTDYFQIAGHLFSGMSEAAAMNFIIAKKQFEIAHKQILTTNKQTTDYLAFVYLGLGLIHEKDNKLKNAKYYFERLEEIGEYTLHQQEVEAFKKRKRD